ncbi:MAG: MotA/TolQ/ExbB proton channel family protein [Planctomycetaceae bacterium]
MNRSPRSRRSSFGALAQVALLTVLMLGCVSLCSLELRGQTGGPIADTDSDPGTGEPAKEEPKGIPRDPMGIILALGWFVYPLGLTSIIALWVAIERLVVLRRGRVIPRHFVKRFFDLLEEGKLDPKSAMKLCEENGSPIAAVFAHGIRKWGKPSVEVEQAIIDGGERQVSQLRSYLRVLNGAATVGPLLGLLGTVWGMVESFNTIALKAAMGKSSELAAGIGLALLTTVVGLLIAIPALVMYMYLAGRVDALVMEMDSLAQELVDFISAEGIMEQQRTAAANRTAAAKPVDARRAV